MDSAVSSQVKVPTETKKGRQLALPSLSVRIDIWIIWFWRLITFFTALRNLNFDYFPFYGNSDGRELEFMPVGKAPDEVFQGYQYRSEINTLQLAGDGLILLNFH